MKATRGSELASLLPHCRAASMRATEAGQRGGLREVGGGSLPTGLSCFWLILDLPLDGFSRVRSWLRCWGAGARTCSLGLGEGHRRKGRNRGSKDHLANWKFLGLRCIPLGGVFRPPKV